VPAGGAATPVVVPVLLGSWSGEPTATPAGPPRCPWVTPNTGRYLVKQIMCFMSFPVR
jgi:DNA-3-methyladenine glycosylase I